MNTIADYTKENVLVIPQALYGMQDVRIVMQQGNSAIFKKCLLKDLTDIEFYTNVPCFIYIESGFESLTTSDNQLLELRAQHGIFLPQGLTLHSDFVRETKELRAYLVFFDEQIVTSFLKTVSHSSKEKVDDVDYCLIQEKNAVFESFFHSFQQEIASQEYNGIKLLELLHLISWQDHDDNLLPLLLKMSRKSPKRNLVRLLNNQDCLKLTVSDLAQISGRSLSSFNRDFKQFYQVPPKKWLQDKRLSYARELLDDEARTVTDVAVEVGYENISNFIKAFKSKYGQTPKQIKMAK